METQFDYFSKLSIEELQDFFSAPQFESETLEFKSGETLPEGICKEACAFANTSGGVIVLGAPREKEVEKQRICQGELLPSKHKWTEDRVQQILMNGVEPIVSNIKVKRIAHTEGHIYVISIPKSSKPPHQHNGTYYMRVGSMSDKAPHAFVEALFNQIVPIELINDVQIVKGEDVFDSNTSDIYELSIGLTNHSINPAKNCEMYVSVVGHVREERIGTDLSFKDAFLNKGKSALYGVYSGNTLVLHLWWRRHFRIRFRKEYLFIQLIIWADNTPAQGILYKFHKTEGLTRFNLYTESPEQKEFYSWTRREDVE